MPNPNLGTVVGNRGGRPRGSLNQTTREAREFAARVIADPEYQADILRRARTGQLGGFEPTLWAYAAGKPPSEVTVHMLRSEDEPLSAMTPAELAERATAIAEQLRQLGEAVPNPDVVDAIAVVDVPDWEEAAQPDGEAEAEDVEH